MIEVAVVDVSAESRSRLVERISAFHTKAAAKQAVIPQLNIKPLSLQELKFTVSPDICIVGAECLSRDLVELASIKKMLPKTRIIAEINSVLGSLVITEQMARLGVDDTFCEETTPSDFMRKLILQMRKTESTKNGQLIVVDSGKGGIGVTSVVSGLSEVCFEAGKRVIAVDLDFETQDLSRFLQARPFINENLQALMQQERPVVSETVEQCITPVWSEERNFSCVPPIPDIPELSDARGGSLRVLLSFFESLDRLADVVIVDIGAARGPLRQALYRIADSVLFVINNDPATLYSVSHRISSALSAMGSSEDLVIVENSSTKYGLPRKFLRDEMGRAIRLDPKCWATTEIPFCARSSRWPASGSTFFGQASKGVQLALGSLAERLSLIPAKVIETSPSKSLLSRLRPLRTRTKEPGQITQEHQNLLSNVKALPAPQQLISEAKVVEKPVEQSAFSLVSESKIVQF